MERKAEQRKTDVPPPHLPLLTGARAYVGSPCADVIAVGSFPTSMGLALIEFILSNKITRVRRNSIVSNTFP